MTPAPLILVTPCVQPAGFEMADRSLSLSDTYQRAILRAREAVLREDLYTMRKLIDEYTLDKQYPPTTLEDLVSAGYMRGGIPADPFTGSNETWQVVMEDVPLSPSQSASGIVDVHSGSDGESMEGTPYSSW